MKLRIFKWFKKSYGQLQVKKIVKLEATTHSCPATCTHTNNYYKLSQEKEKEKYEYIFNHYKIESIESAVIQLYSILQTP